MHTFKDENGKEWVVRLDGPKVREARKLGIDLAAVDGSAVQKLTDPVLLVDTLWILCRTQAQAANVSDVLFGEVLVGDAIECATDALIEAINDFFPLRLREQMRKMHAQMKATREAAMDQAMDSLADPTLQTKILAAMKTKAQMEIDKLLRELTQSGSATNSPAPSESVPTD